MTTSNISISKDRVSVEFNGKFIQFVIWDLEEDQFETVKSQLNLAFSICPDFESIENHMRINGFDCHLEDIY